MVVSAQREGLKNYLPITVGTNIYGVNVIKGDPNHIFDQLSKIDPPNYEKKYKHYPRSDVLLDMQYFNNASNLIFQLNL
jgi:hypothetical protein